MSATVDNRATGRHRPFRKILLGYDGSPCAESALDIAHELAVAWKAKLYLIGVESLPQSSTADAFEAAVKSALAHYAEKFYRIRLAGMNEGLQVDTFIALGDPAECLLRKAQRLRANLIIVGSGTSRLGPAREYVVREATCPVLAL